MKYRSVLHYRANTPDAVLLRCLRDLKSLDLKVTWFSEERAIAFEVPETMLAWLKAGGLRTLLTPYQKHIVRLESFREVEDENPRLASADLTSEAKPSP
jgi:hypothetical protein